VYVRGQVRNTPIQSRRFNSNRSTRHLRRLRCHFFRQYPSDSVVKLRKEETMRLGMDGTRSQSMLNVDCKEFVLCTAQHASPRKMCCSKPSSDTSSRHGIHVSLALANLTYILGLPLESSCPGNENDLQNNSQPTKMPQPLNLIIRRVTSYRPSVGVFT
jgi:hypothetical protein